MSLADIFSVTAHRPVSEDCGAGSRVCPNCSSVGLLHPTKTRVTSRTSIELDAGRRAESQ